jgi:serine/threonine protein kinase
MGSLVEFLQDYERKYIKHTDLPIEITDQYEIISCLKETDYKQVYLVLRKSDGVKCILKCLSILSHENLEEEYRLQSSLAHDGLTTAIAFMKNESYHYLIREYVEGYTVTEKVEMSKEGRLSDELIIDITKQLCQVLHYLHSRKPPIIHRDIKPDNVIITADGRVKLIDFSISRYFQDGLNRDTIIMGTKQMTPPEQYGYMQTNARSDIYSLGILMFYMATGSVDINEIGEYKVAGSVKKCIKRCTRFTPKERYKNVKQLERRLLTAKESFHPGRILMAATVGILVVTALLCYRIFAMKLFDQKDHIIHSTSNVIPVSTEDTADEKKPVNTIRVTSDDTIGIKSGQERSALDLLISLMQAIDNSDVETTYETLGEICNYMTYDLKAEGYELLGEEYKLAYCDLYREYITEHENDLRVFYERYKEVGYNDKAIYDEAIVNSGLWSAAWMLTSEPFSWIDERRIALLPVNYIDTLIYDVKATDDERFEALLNLFSYYKTYRSYDPDFWETYVHIDMDITNYCPKREKLNLYTDRIKDWMEDGRMDEEESVIEEYHQLYLYDQLIKQHRIPGYGTNRWASLGVMFSVIQVDQDEHDRELSGTLYEPLLENIIDALPGYTVDYYTDQESRLQSYPAYDKTSDTDQLQEALEKLLTNMENRIIYNADFSTYIIHEELMPQLREELLYLATNDSYNLLGKQNAFYYYIENKDSISGEDRSQAIINCVRCIVRNLYYEQEKYLSNNTTSN